MGDGIFSPMENFFPVYNNSSVTGNDMENQAVPLQERTFQNLANVSILKLEEL